jgi:RNA polymerase sigma factor (sigma-70 family)
VIRDPHIEEVDVQGIASLFERYKKVLAKAVARIVKPGDIEDVVQETYLRIFRAAKRETIRHPRSFMLTAARNLALNHISRADALNHLATTPCDTGEEGSETPVEFQAPNAQSPETVAQAEEEFLIFCRAIREFPLQCRRAFILRKVYGLSQREVASELGISESTVEKHIAKGLTACSSFMAAHGYTRSTRASTGRGNLRRRHAK